MGGPLGRGRSEVGAGRVSTVGQPPPCANLCAGCAAHARDLPQARPFRVELAANICALGARSLEYQAACRSCHKQASLPSSNMSILAPVALMFQILNVSSRTVLSFT